MVVVSSKTGCFDFRFCEIVFLNFELTFSLCWADADITRKQKLLFE